MTETTRTRGGMSSSGLVARCCTIRSATRTRFDEPCQSRAPGGSALDDRLVRSRGAQGAGAAAGACSGHRGVAAAAGLCGAVSGPRTIEEPARRTPLFAEYDIVVLGGGPAGIAAAAAAARAPLA